MSGQGSGGNVIAALCNVFVPGLGQLIQGRVLAAILFAVFYFASVALWWLIFPLVVAGITWLWSIIDAARFRP